MRQLAWLLVLLAVAPTWSAEPTRLQEGGYRFDGELYQATVDPRGRLATLQVGSQDSDLDVIPQDLGACQGF